MNKQLFEKLLEQTARIQSIIHIGGMVTDGDSLPDAIDDLLEEDDATLEQCFPDMPDWVKQELNDRHMRGSAFVEWVLQSEKLGFVVQFATPVMRNLGEGSRSYSWGYYCTHWVYGENLEEAVTKALSWVSDCRAKEMKKQSAKASAS